MKQKKLITRTATLSIFMGALIVILGSCNMGPPEGSRGAQALKGKVHFDKYCVGCHGADGKGLAVDSLKKKPADLTRITAGRKSTDFPVLEVARMIDGRKMPAYHGESGMPVWGEVFAQEELLDESQIKGKLAELIAYLIAIQGS